MSNRSDTVSNVANDSYIKLSNRNDTLSNPINTTSSISFAIKTLGEFSDYYIPIFVCLSLLINSLTAYVFFCTKLRHFSSSIYLGALAISDIGVLIMMFENWFELRYFIDVEWLDIFLTGSETLFDFMSLWIIVIFIVQRYIAMKWPLLRHLDTVNRAKTVVIGLAVLAVLICIPKFIIILCVYAMYIKNKEMMDSMNSTNDKEQYEFIDNKQLEILFDWWRICKIFDAIITFVLPTTIIAILNVLIVYKIRKHNRIQRNLSLSSAASNKETQSSNNETSYIEITKMLVIISSIIIFLNTPFQICQLLVYEIKISDNLLYIISIITLLLWLTNYAINFFLHCATGKNFRSELIRIFTKRSDTRRNEDIYIH